ncbi:toll/interleukin-1 receptor domain-containing protein [Plantactinospora sp. CA-290183]|uniref:toll/interleukin-1 receptor domain-containing protein n=1 Tax=Plantactinospora sp. CA-290183 TaxID=3240006 RepID=UPI003D934413
MSDWRVFPERTWSAIGRTMSGSGPGEGPYGLSYAVDTGIGPFLNGRVSARIRLARRSGTQAAGLVCRADEHRSLVAYYFVTEPDSPELFALRIATFKHGQLSSIVGLRKPVDLGANDEVHLALQFFSGEIVGQVMVGDEVHTLRSSVPGLPFPGYGGVVRFYNTSVLVRGVHIEEIGTKPVLPEEPESVDHPHRFAAFISHSATDQEAVAQLVARLREANIPYWIDHEQITFGDPIVAKIEEGLQQSRSVVVCLSANLVSSGWCRAEYGPILYREFSGDTSRRVIPLSLDGSTGSGSTPLLLSDKMRADFTDQASMGRFLAFLARPSA